MKKNHRINLYLSCLPDPGHYLAKPSITTQGPFQSSFISLNYWKQTTLLDSIFRYSHYYKELIINFALVNSTLWPSFRLRIFSSLNPPHLKIRTRLHQISGHKYICSPMKAIPFLWRSSGSFGFSEAWPQPAQTACRTTQHNSLFVITKQAREQKYKACRYFQIFILSTEQKTAWQHPQARPSS